ncbi:DUF268 domain-containing protein [Desulfovibrio inopinatus]|uniref:DUF268 domain-containing protein n=1 Tax=Desulfovibrio inopinatus TaxID=102109 RepID=UPI0004187783|nr:DUF268 domain-containing protein [Desulfovibrio inopinatus]
MLNVLHSFANLKANTIAIYGAGAYGLSVRNDIAQERPDITVACFLDTFKPSGTIDDFDLVNINDVDTTLLQSLDAIIIASANYEDIGEKVEKLGFSSLYILMRSLEDEKLRQDKNVFEATEALISERDYHRYFHTMYYWRYLALRQEHFGDPAPVPPLMTSIPPEMREAFTMGGQCEILDYKVWDKRYPSNYPLIYTDEEVDDCLRRIDEGENSIYGQLDVWFREALQKYPIEGTEVAVMGSLTPWYESLCIKFGGHPVTIDYNAIISKTKRISTLTTEELKSRKSGFDHAISISSFEHDGLGAYGDPIDPDGDLKAMRNMKNVIKPGGLMFFNVPVSWDDMIYFNEFRSYGRVRLAMMFEGFELVDSWGYSESRLQAEPKKVFNPLFVLKNK